jgi:hypothetical protein
MDPMDERVDDCDGPVACCMSSSSYESVVKSITSAVVVRSIR